MSDNTTIEWSDATWNPITGCSIVSAGCQNCYAMRLAGGRLKNHPSRIRLTPPGPSGPIWTGEVRFNGQWIDQPFRWRRSRRVFVCAHGDLFHEDVPDAWIDRVFAVMALANLHEYQVLTKRPDRMLEYCERVSGESGVRDMVVRYGGEIDRAPWPLPNVWLGVSVEDQETADRRIPILLQTPAAVRWVSAEPLLGPIDLTMLHYSLIANFDALAGKHGHIVQAGDCESLDWVVAGGESGRGARPMHPDWVRSIRDQCVDANVAFHFKQWGEWVYDEVCDIARRPGKKRAGRVLDGRTWDRFPV